MKRDTTAERCPAPNRRLRLETVSLTDDLLFGDIWRRLSCSPQPQSGVAENTPHWV
jgi:hypothetical protein